MAVETIDGSRYHDARSGSDTRGDRDAGCRLGVERIDFYQVWNVHDDSIPEVMTRLYEARFWGIREAAARRYLRIPKPRADACVACGECEAKCTQKLKIGELMREAARDFGGEEG
jgi:ferredoxin